MLDSVSMDILQVADGQHWNESLNGGIGDWQSDPYWNSSDIYTSSWSYRNTNPDWASGINYTLVIDNCQ